MSISIAEITTFLESHHLFAMLPSPMLRDLAHKCELQEYDSGEVVYTAGDEAIALYLIYSGVIVLHNDASAPNRIEEGGRQLTRLQGGEFFGGRVLLEGSRQLDTVRALQPTIVIVCNRDVVAMLARKYRLFLDRIRLHNRSLHLLRTRGTQAGLQSLESVSLLCVPHWACLALRMFTPLFFLSGAVFGAVGLAANDFPWWQVILGSGIIFPTWIALLVVDWRDDAYLVTNKRVVSDERLMIIHKTRAEAPLKRIRAVEVTQGAIAQIFGYGDVLIQAFAGQVIFRNVANPRAVREVILDSAQKARDESRAVDQQTIAEIIRSGLGLQSVTPGHPSVRQVTLESDDSEGGTILAILHYWFPRIREQRGTAVTWRKHPLKLIQRLAGGVLGIVFMSFVAISGPGSVPFFVSLFPWDAFLILGFTVFAFWVWYQFEDWRADVYTLTPERLIDSEKKPLLGRLTQRSAPIESVLNVSYSRPGIVANLFNYGTVIVETGGEAGRLTFDWVGNPLSVQQDIFLRLEEYFDQQEDEEAQQRQREIADWLTAYSDITHSPQTD